MSMDISWFAVLVHLLFGTSYSSQYQVQKQTSLSAAAPVNNGATVSINPASTTISSSDPFTYHVNIHAHSLGYDLKLSLNASWSFLPNTSSTLTITIDGVTPNADNDTDLFLVFAVADEQYLSFYTHLDDSSHIQSRIYFHDAGGDSSNNHTNVPVSEWMVDDRLVDRWDRLSNGDRWVVLEHDTGAAAVWPLRFEVRNDAVSDRAWFTFVDNASSDSNKSRVEYGVGSAFATQQRVDVYLLADAYGQSFDVSELQVALSYDGENDGAVVVDVPTAYRVLIKLKFAAATNATRQLPWAVHERLSAFILQNMTGLRTSCEAYALGFESVQIGSSAEYPLMMNIEGSVVFCGALGNVSHWQTSMAAYLQNSGFFNVTLAEASIALLVATAAEDVLVNDTVIPPSQTKVEAGKLTTTATVGGQWPLDPTQKTKQKLDTDLLMWLMKLIAAQLILCCVFVMIILLIKYATFKMRAKREATALEKYAVKTTTTTTTSSTAGHGDCGVSLDLASKPNTSTPATLATFDSRSQMGVPAAASDGVMTEKFCGVELENAQQPMLSATVSRNSKHNSPKKRSSNAASLILKISNSRSVKSAKSAKSSKSVKSKASNATSQASKHSQSKTSQVSKKSQSKSRGTKLSKSKSKKNSKAPPPEQLTENRSAHSKHSRINAVDSDDGDDENEEEEEQETVHMYGGDEQRMLQQQQQQQQYDNDHGNHSDSERLQFPLDDMAAVPMSSMANLLLQRAPSSKSVNSAVSAQLPPAMDVFSDGGGGVSTHDHGRNFSTLSQEICDDIFDEPSQRHSDDNLLADIDESMELEADDESLAQRIIGQTTSIPPASELVNDEQMGRRLVRGNTICSDHSRYPSIPDGNPFGAATNGNANGSSNGNGTGATSELKKLFSRSSAARQKSKHHLSPTLTFSLPKYLRRNGVV